MSPGEHIGCPYVKELAPAGTCGFCDRLRSDREAVARVLALSPEEVDTLVALLRDPPAPTEGLRKALSLAAALRPALSALRDELSRH